MLIGMLRPHNKDDADNRDKAEAMLAFVIGHELGHCIARHCAERIGLGVVVSFVVSCVAKLISASSAVISPPDDNTTLVEVGS
jgi:predicted Zn-dependent protease